MRGKAAGLCLLLLVYAMINGSKDVESVKGTKEKRKKKERRRCSSVFLILSV